MAGRRQPKHIGTQFVDPVLFAPSSSVRDHRAESIITNSAEGDGDSSRSTIRTDATLISQQTACDAATLLLSSDRMTL